MKADIVVACFEAGKAKVELGCFIENHCLGDEGVDVADVNQAVLGTERRKIILQMAAIMGLVIALRKEFQKSIILRTIPALQRIY